MPKMDPTSGSGEVAQSPVEFRELVNGLVPYERFADKEDLIGVVDRNELC